MIFEDDGRLDWLTWEDEKGRHSGLFYEHKIFARWPLETPPTRDQARILWLLWDTQDEAGRVAMFDEDTVRRELRLYDA